MRRNSARVTPGRLNDYVPSNVMKEIKSKTMDEFCEQPAGTFQSFVKTKEAHVQALETERKERIRAAQKAPQELAWAA